VRRLLWLLLVLAACSLASQEVRSYRIVNADSLHVVRQPDDEYVTHLLGNVHFFYGETEFLADRAEVYDKKEIARLMGRVQVLGDPLDLFADSVAYRRSDQRLDLGGNGRALRDTLALTADKAVYYRERQRLEVEGHVLYTETHADGTTRSLAAHNATSLRNPESLVADGHVRAWDERENTHGRCGHAEYHRADGYAFLIQNPELWSSGDDSLYISAEKMEWFETSGKLVANFNVITSSKEYNTRSDFLIYLTETEEAVFLGQPKFFSQQAEGEAREFHLYLVDRNIDHATFLDSCRVEFRTGDAGDMNNRVNADWMEFRFANRKLSGFTAEGNVDSYFEQLHDAKHDYSANAATGDRMTVTIGEDEEVETVTMQGGVQGKYRFESKQE